jgi:phosphatidylethanolamine/phosphatidyl-N-methylethanolamine N-methyltransferase
MKTTQQQLYTNASASHGKRQANRFDTETVRNTYHRYAKIYDLYFGPVMQRGRKAVMQKMNCKPGDKILEVGVGTGLSLSLYPGYTQVSGIDISSEMLDRARARKERLGLDHVVELQEMDAERMLFPDDSFDKVAAIYVATVVPQPIRLVNEMRRVCKPDGELFFLNHFHSQHPILNSLERILAPLSGALFRPDMSLDHFTQETELEVIEKIPANLFGYWTLLRARNNKKAVSEAPTHGDAARHENMTFAPQTNA